MKRTLILSFAVLIAIILFGGLVYAVLVVAQASEPSATTIRGATPRRLWATASAVLGLTGVVVGGLTLRRPSSQIGTKPGKSVPSVVLVLGLVAAASGGLNLAMAQAGPGSGNGVVGAAAALVLGLIAVGLGSLALTRSRPTAGS